MINLKDRPATHFNNGDPVRLVDNEGLLYYFPVNKTYLVKSCWKNIRQDHSHEYLVTLQEHDGWIFSARRFELAHETYFDEELFTI